MKIISDLRLTVALTTIVLFILSYNTVNAATFAVTSLSDSGSGSLREAISLANSNPGTDTIEFAVVGAINLLSQLPTLSDSTGGTTIDGTTAPGYIDAPVVILRGPSSTGSFFGLYISSANNKIQGLQIDSFSFGIYIPLSSTATNNVITGNYIGTDGNIAVPNSSGIIIQGSNNRIGTDGDGINDAAERNVISGQLYQGISINSSSGSGNIVAGNFIGTDATGTIAIPNGSSSTLWDLPGVNISSANYNRIGTDGNGIADEAERNIISGNNSWGVSIHYGDNNIVAGNYIGVDVTGMNALGNRRAGVQISGGGNNNRIGTDGNGIADEAERNVISANGSGVEIRHSDTNGTIVAGNYIGTNVAGLVSLGNTYGILVEFGASGTRIGTDSNGMADDIERNVISGNIGWGVSVFNGVGNVIAGNYIGVDANGTTALGNGAGVHVSGAIRVGTNGDGINDNTERNIISGNTNIGAAGVYVTGPGATITGNYIGTDVTGIVPLGNSGNGVEISGAGFNTITSNTIAFNGGDGVILISYGPENKISKNSIFENGGLGIDLQFSGYLDGVNPNDLGDGDGGPNNLQNFPVVTSVTIDGAGTTVEGELNSTPNAIFTLEFFSNNTADPSGFGEGETFFGSTIVTTDGSGNVSFMVTLPTAVPLGQFITTTATDSNGNTSEFSASFVLADNNSPIANAGSDQIIECSSTGSVDVTLYGMASSDPEGDILTYAWTGSFGVATGPAPTVNLGLGTHTVTLTVDDGNGGTATDTVLITIEDTIPPTVNAGPDVILEATGSSGANYDVLSQIIAIDSCCAVSFLISPAGLYPIGSTTVTVTATDCGLNSSSDTMFVAVVDTTPPVVTAPPDITMEASGSTTPVTLGTGTAMDLVDGTLTPTPDQTGPFAVGVRTIVWSATDSSGNTGTAIQTVMVTDSTPPVITVPSDVTVEATGAQTIVAIGTATAIDIVDGTVAVSNDAPIAYSVGTTVVTWMAADGSGNSATAMQNVNITDTTAPAVTAPGDIIVEASGQMTSVTLGTGTATDLVDGMLTPTPDQSGPFAVGIHTIIWSATDSSENTGTANQVVIVTDTTPPIMTVPLDILAEATSLSGAVVNYPPPTVIDIADPFPSVVCNPASGSTFSIGITTVNCIASDASGNSSNGSFEVTVVSSIEVTDVSLDILPQGATNQDITITGDNFEAGTTVSFSGSGIVVNAVTFMNANQLIVNISIDSVASEGLRDVVVTNTNGLSGTGIGLLQIVTQSGAISDMSNDVSDFLITGEISNSGIANSLLASLNNANKTLDRNAISAANGILNALINKLDAYLKGNQISSSVKASLETKINALISSL